ncbi:MAG: PQQ-binding-like beta-propeller repeat protein [Planctomycetaceae bacterium]
MTDRRTSGWGPGLAVAIALVAGGGAYHWSQSRVGLNAAGTVAVPPLAIQAADDSVFISASAPAGKSGVPQADRPEGQDAAVQVYLPQQAAPYRGWIALISRGDSQWFFENGRMRSMANELGFGMIHFQPLSQVDGSGAAGEELLNLLAEQARIHQRPELQFAPLVLMGHSSAFNFAISFASNHPEHVLGLIGFRTSEFRTNGLAPAVHRQIPWLVLAGEQDQAYRIEHAARLAQLARNEQLPITILHQRDGHHFGPQAAGEGLPVILNWIPRIVDEQLPAEGTANGYPPIERLRYDTGLAADVQGVKVGALTTVQARPTLTTWIPDEAFGRVWLKHSVPIAKERIPPDVIRVLAKRQRVTADTASPLPTRETDWLCWLCWRGQNGTGRAAAGNPAVRWTESENIAWKTPLAGRGHSSPIVVDGHIYLTTADDEERILLQSFDADSGRLEWERELTKGRLPDKHLKNSHASTTVACDGQSLFVNYITAGSLWLAACDRQGKVLWKQKVGPFNADHGYGSSPVLYGSSVIVVADNRVDGYLAAYHRETGELIWRTSRPAGHSYGTPIVAHVAGRDQLVMGASTSRPPMIRRPVSNFGSARDRRK